MIGYCDKSDLENFLLLDIDESFDNQINDWISAAEKIANKYMGYTTASGVMSENIVDETAYGRIDNQGNLIVFPSKVPVTAVSALNLVKGSESLTMTLEDSSGNDKYNIPSTSDFIFFPGSEFTSSGTSVVDFSQLRSTKFFTKIDYTAGYSTVPDDIKQATVNLLADIVMRHSNKEGLESITQGRVTKRYWSRQDGHSDFYLDAMSMLKPYRIASRWIV
jgi:hypothetical protein